MMDRRAFLAASAALALAPRVSFSQSAKTLRAAPGRQALVGAGNPGDWMLHCHVLEHQASGMMGVMRVG
jgi:hypothetical protein